MVNHHVSHSPGQIKEADPMISPFCRRFFHSDHSDPIFSMGFQVPHLMSYLGLPKSWENRQKNHWNWGKFQDLPLCLHNFHTPMARPGTL